ncbi:MAG: hypothetical protein LBT61_04370 [Prevotellaceae bacterium]|jgi:hypothetical protein|nr:hypothetical protein [Prevotellaceae bacterium]
MFSPVQRNPFATSLVCLALLFILWIPALFLPIAPETLHLKFMMPLQQWMIEDLQLQGQAGIWTSFLMVSFGACLLFVINREHLFVSGQEQLMLPLFILLSSAMPYSQQFSGSQAAALFVLLSLYYLFRSIQAIRATSSLFLSSFFTALAGLFYFPSVIILFTIFIGILISKPFAWRDWMAYCAGIAAPYFYLFFHHYLCYGTYIDLLEKMIENIPPPALPEFTFSIPEIALFILLIIMALSSFFPSRSGGSLVKVKHTRMRQILKCLLLCLLVSALLFSASQPGIISLMAIPLSILAADYYDHIRRKKIFNLLLFLICLAVAGIRIL